MKNTRTPKSPRSPAADTYCDIPMDAAPWPRSTSEIEIARRPSSEGSRPEGLEMAGAADEVIMRLGRSFHCTKGGKRSCQPFFRGDDLFPANRFQLGICKSEPLPLKLAFIR